MVKMMSGYLICTCPFNFLNILYTSYYMGLKIDVREGNNKNTHPLPLKTVSVYLRYFDLLRVFSLRVGFFSIFFSFLWLI